MAQAASSGPAPTLVELVERFSLVDALDEGAPPGAVAYLEKLAEVLEDGEVTAEEAADLAAIAEAEQLSNADISSANHAFVLALANAAMEDGKVTRAERAELQSVAGLLGVKATVIPAFLDQAESARNQRLSSNLQQLPAHWAHGEPLRVGDKVAFTGCEDSIRTRLENESERLGVRVINSVSTKTAMLVSDGSVDGGKAAKARELGTRTVEPNVYEVLLAHLQPARARAVRRLPETATAPERAQRHTNTSADASERISGLRAATDTSSGPNPAEVRAWARANGLEVGVRGRLQTHLVAAFIAAQQVEDDQS